MRVALILSISCFFSTHCVAQSNRAIDSLEKLVKSKTTDSVKILALSELCWEYRGVDQKKAIAYGSKAVTLARKTKSKTGLSKSLNDLSIIYIDQTKLDTAAILLEEVLKIRIELKDSIGIGAVHNKLGIVYQTKMELKKALEHNLKALDIFEKKGITPYVTQCLNNIGIIHFNLKNYDKSLEFHNKCIDIRKKSNDEWGVAASYVNVANVFLETHDTAKAIVYLKDAITVFKRIKNERELSFACHDLGAIYSLQRQYRTAKPYAEQALELRRKLADNRAIASSLILSGEVNAGLGNFKESKKNLDEALKICIEQKIPDEEKFAYQKMAFLYTMKGMADSVFYYYGKYEQINSRFYEKNLSDQVVDLQESYDAVNREKKILEAEKKALKAENARQNLFRWIYILAIAVLIAGGYFLFQTQRNKRLAQKKLHDALMAEREAGLKAVVDATEEERKRIAKDLHDGVGQQMTGLKMAWEKLSVDINSATPEHFAKLVELTKILDDASGEVRSISHQMMPKVLTELGLVPAIEDMLNKAFKLSGIQHEFVAINVKNRFDERIEISLYRVCQELVNNILKHSGATQVMVQIIQQKNVLVMMVEDNGKGLGSIDKQGLGMLSMNTRLNTVNGKINYDPGPETGTLVTIRIPL
ncbi:MAG TPA: sensor histidine kinase [Flavobacteriales bacterium]|nr:sensor histidine kinase [Flavobacteriales bacterium]